MAGASKIDVLFASLERRIDGRLGIAVIDVLGSARIFYRANERFALASVQKLPLVMTVLSRVDQRRERLARVLRFSRRDLVGRYSVIAQQYPNGAAMTVESLCALAISESDSTAADLLTASVGGPHAVTAYLRSIGVRDIRVDHTERELPSRAQPNVAIDSATPLALAELIVRLASHSPLSNASTALLLHWMSQTHTGNQRLRAGLPAGWSIADKTGSYENAANDVGLVSSPNGSSFAVAVFCQTPLGTQAGEAAIRAVAQDIAKSLS